jgi:hypothetical protein
MKIIRSLSTRWFSPTDTVGLILRLDWCSEMLLDKFLTLSWLLLFDVNLFASQSAVT